MRRRGAASALAGLFGLALAACEGSGSSGGGLVVEREPIAPNCTPVGGAFPSGLALLSAASGRALLGQFQPPALWLFDLEAERPRPLAIHDLDPDSDGDGLADGPENARVLGLPFSLPPAMGEVTAPRDDLALVSTSDYEQVLVFDAATATPRAVTLETPAAVAPGDYPFWPAPGASAARSGISTRVCIFPPDPIDSGGAAIGPDARCDASAPSYLTTLTAGKALAGGRLFVATSNLRSGDRFRPGTVLVFEWIESASGILVHPEPVAPVIFTHFFNPTGVRRALTPGGREVVLVATTGAIGAGTGGANVRGEGAVEVIDPSVPRLAAVIPLGFAGPSFDAPALDPGGRVAWLGASSQRQLYAVDLRALDDPRLYAGAGPPVRLDGLDDAGFPDARIFHAGAPLALPDRADGPSPALCEGFTHAAVNAAGAEVFATDFCDGTFTRVRAGLGGAPPVPYPPDRFPVAGQQAPFAPSDAIGLLRAPGALRVRPGVPGVDYAGPDVLVVVGQPEAQLCALRVESL